jgi:hypothetical protein|tara:strand:- start:813 stop:1592 length:780 start_codon:yes stop_codon:yes gene_type:complete
MKKYIIILFAFIGSFVNAQEYDFQELCLTCAEQGGFYCGDDPTNWTQYSPDGCVQAGWINDGWEDCVDASDENEAAPTLPADCAPPPPPPCDTIYVDVVEYVNLIDTVEVPFFIYETVIQFDTIVETEYITTVVVDTFEVATIVPEYIYITDTITVYEDILDTLVVEVPVVEYVDTIIYDTVVETEYLEIFVVDTVVEYIEVINTEYIDCDSGLPCNSAIMEIVDKSKTNGVIYNIKGQAVLVREGLYIEGGKIYYKTK